MLSDFEKLNNNITPSLKKIIMVVKKSRKKSLMDIKKNNIDVQFNKYILPIQKSMLFYFALIIIIILEITFIY